MIEVTSIRERIKSLQARKDSLPPQVLPAGDYWFYMAGISANIRQATGLYGDNTLYVGIDANPDLELGVAFSSGDGLSRPNLNYPVS